MRHINARFENIQSLRLQILMGEAIFADMNNRLLLVDTSGVAWKTPGIAALYMLHFPNGKKYIGVTTDPKRRRRAHARTKPIFRVHRALEKYQKQGVIMQVMAVGEERYILDLEVKAIAAFRSTDPDFGYNVLPGGEINPMRNPATVEKMRRSLTGRKDPPEVIAKKRASWTPERHEKNRLKARSQRHTPESRAKISASLRGRKHSPESIEKMKAAQRKIAAPRPQWVRDKISQAVKGMTLTAEQVERHRLRLSSEETRSKIAAASQVRWLRQNGPRMSEQEAISHWKNSSLTEAGALEKMTGWNKRTARRIFGKRGIFYKKFPAAIIAEVHHRVLRGEGAPTISRATGVSSTHIYRLTKSSRQDADD